MTIIKQSNFILTVAYIASSVLQHKLQCKNIVTFNQFNYRGKTHCTEKYGLKYSKHSVMLVVENVGVVGQN